MCVWSLAPLLGPAARQRYKILSFLVGKVNLWDEGWERGEETKNSSVAPETARQPRKAEEKIKTGNRFRFKEIR